MTSPKSTAAAFILLLLACPAWAQDPFAEARHKMVEENIAAEGVRNERVLQSMRHTPRHEFVPRNQRRRAYLDMALPIGEGQTISPPFVVAYMTEQLDPRPTDKVLEIGTGSGYQAAVLSPLVKDVYTIEIVEPLGRRAATTLRRLKYDNVHTKIGDGFQGWPEHAPFDKIIVTCSPEDIPQPLVEQLAEGGRMIIPLGERYQQTLYLFGKKDGKLIAEKLLPTMFVPMTGRAEEHREVLPDPARPELVNGGFEEVNDSTGKADAWYYQRQVEYVSEGDAPEGDRYARFTNSDPGRGAHAVQAFAVDGRQVRELAVEAMVRGQGIRPGLTPRQIAGFMLSFYDEDRRPVGQPLIPVGRGAFAWRGLTTTVKVPASARECIVHIGLMGATGEVSFDDLAIRRAR